MRTPLVIGIAGGSGSGKSTVVARLIELMGRERLALLEQDAYYRDAGALSPVELQARNYDHPEAIDEELLIRHARALREGRPVQAPCYDFVRHARRPETRPVTPRPCIVVEGILVLASEALRSLMDLRLYVDTDADVRFIRRLRRDVQERGRTVESVIQQWEATVRPMHIQFVEPSRRHADLIIPEGGLNTAALDVLLARVQAAVGV